VPLALALAAIEPIDWRLPARDWCLLALLGATYGAGNLTVLAAYRAGGKASIVTPLTALYPLMTIPVALVLFGEALDASEWAGVVLALLAAVALSYEPERAAAPES
jgi:transporter family protein